MSKHRYFLAFYRIISPNYLNDDEYRLLQTYLIEHPNAGSVITGTGGLRKIRWAAKGHGKRGGIRVIYYFYTASDRIYMLTLYAKNEMSDLNADEKKALRKIVEQLIDET